MNITTPASDFVFEKSELQNLETALTREWLVANHLGGYASASLAGANTRRYHGLLVAAVNPPVGRAVLLSKIEESIEIVSADGGQSPTFPLSVNLYPGAVYPQGHRCLERFEALPCPTWTWSPMPGVRFERRIWMAAGKNTTYITYTLIDAPEGASANLHLVPLFAWKDYHSEMRATDAVRFQWHRPASAAQKPGNPCGVLTLPIPPIRHVSSQSIELNLHFTDGAGDYVTDISFLPQQYWFYHFQHPRERERGQSFSEDLLNIGMFSATLKLGQSITVIATIETETPVAPDRAWEQLIGAQSFLLQGMPAPDGFARDLALAAEAFLVDAPNVRATIIAGYPWFCDWGRDTMISLPGLCLPTGRADLARDILLSYVKYVSQGMLPNRFPDAGLEPEYNTVDATLWYFVAIYRYWEATGDLAVVRDSLWPVLEEILLWHRKGTRYGIKVDADSLLAAGESGVQLTWMDARVGNWVVTPRTGKPVEINALWHSALKIMAHFAALLGLDDQAAAYEEDARRCAAVFAARFARHDGRGLYDVIDTPRNNAPDESIRPNQIFAVSLPFAPLAADTLLAQSVIETVQAELLTPVGLRTLSPSDPAFVPRYEGDSRSRDGAYHQGTVWTWLLGAFAEAHFKVNGDREIARGFLRPLRTEMSRFGVGSLAEIYDATEPYRPNGCIAQAWSVAETLRVWTLLNAE